LSSYHELLELVAAELRQVEAKMQATNDTYEPLAAAINLLLDSGGKRMRPVVALLVGKSYPGVDTDKLVSLAAAIETLHSATLVHDDVIDGSLLRRGNPTLNASWSQGATILAGDFLFARAAAFAAATGNVRVMDIFSQTLMTICEGELHQLFDLHNWDQPRDAYYRRIYGKTAALFAAAGEAAAVLGGASEDEIVAFRDYGHDLGMAFQIMDDILDFIGDQAVVGKPVGHDLRQGTITLPVFHYLRLNPAAAEALHNSHSHASDEADQTLDQLIAAIGRSPAIEATRQEAIDFIASARQKLAGLSAAGNRQALGDLADYVVSRSL